MTGSCLRPYSRPPGAAVHLVCFPHAGGAATTYRPWTTLLPPSIRLTAVQYSGRQDRLNDQAATSMDALAGEIWQALSDDPLPVLLFGHSFGATVAFEVARWLQRRGSAPVRHLVASGRPGPQAPDQVRTTKHRWGDDELWTDMLRLGGTEQQLASLPALRDLVLPGLRQDYFILENYRPAPETTVSCPVTAFLGAGDPDVSRAQAEAWAKSTTGPFELRVFAGAHFYLSAQPARVVSALLSLV